jgi:hypothetical protein
MRKRYCTYSMRLTLTIKVDGKGREILFNGRDAERKLSTYETPDEKVQEAIEKSQQFGSFYWLDTRQDVVEEEKTEEPLIEKVFENINLAKDFLSSEPYNVAKNRMINLPALENRAKELGFVFKIEKINK